MTLISSGVGESFLLKNSPDWRRINIFLDEQSCSLYFRYFFAIASRRKRDGWVIAGLRYSLLGIHAYCGDYLLCWYAPTLHLHHYSWRETSGQATISGQVVDRHLWTVADFVSSSQALIRTRILRENGKYIPKEVGHFLGEVFGGLDSYFLGLCHAEGLLRQCWGGVSDHATNATATR